MPQPRLHPYYRMVLETRPVYLFDVSLPRKPGFASSTRYAWNLSSRKANNGTTINGMWQGSPLAVDNVRLPKGLHGAARTLLMPDSSGTRGWVLPSTVGAITNPEGFCIAGWVYMGTSARGSLIKIGGGADGWSIGVGSSNHEGSGNDVIGLYEAVRWLPTGWNGLTAGRWHFIALWCIAGSSTSPHVYADGAWRSIPVGTGALTPSNAGRVGSSNANETLRTLNAPIFAPTFWHHQHPGNRFPFTDSTRALRYLNRLYAHGLKGLYPDPTHRRAVLVG